LFFVVVTVDVVANVDINVVVVVVVDVTDGYNSASFAVGAYSAAFPCLLRFQLLLRLLMLMLLLLFMHLMLLNCRYIVHLLFRTIL
jgi:hypothetical protein